MDKNTFDDAINAQLQRKTTPDAYWHHAEDAFEEWDSDYLPYWLLIPTYTVALCPLCEKPFTQQLDTYSLYNWSLHGTHTSVTYSYRKPTHCEHFVGVHPFINLQGKRLYKKDVYRGSLESAEPEVPHVTRTLLPDDLDAVAVLHALPMCRMTTTGFEPLYRLYTLTYYSSAPDELQDRRMFEWTDGVRLRFRVWTGDSGMRLMAYWEEVKDDPDAFDLAAWVKRGKLRWMNPVTQQLNATDDAFPYANIEGVRHAYTYRDGEFKLRHTRSKIDQFREFVPRLVEMQEEAYQWQRERGDLD